MRRYQVAYFKLLRTVSNKLRGPDAYGCSDNLNNLVRNAAGRAAIENYKKAIILDRKTEKILYILKRHQGNITIESP